MSEASRDVLGMSGGPRPAWRLPVERSVYVWVALALPLAAAFVGYAAPTTWQVKGQSVTILLWLTGTALVIGLWIPFRRSTRWPWAEKSVLILLLLSWGFQIWGMTREGVGFNYSAFCVPILLALLFTKPPGMPDVLTAIRVFSFGVLAVAAASIIFDLVNLAPSGFVAGRNGFNRIPVLSDLLGINTRWDGAFQHSNYAGMIGGSVIVLSLALGRRDRWVLIPGGAMILMLSQSRTGALAAIAGLIVWAMLTPAVRRLRHAAAIRWLGAGLFVLGVMLYIGNFDPTLGRRTDAWQQFWLLWTGSPLTGVGTIEVDRYFRQATNADVLAFTHAHNLILDQAARYGLFLAILTLGELVVVVAAVVRATRSGAIVTAALFTFIVACALVEVPTSPIYISVLSMPLLLLVLLTGASRNADSQASIITSQDRDSRRLR